ncbi:MAG: adenylosuccinate synthetase [Rhizobacter sp.]|nr:adenylosuccinate synthetase [Rhizobacter sp.]
MSLIGARFVSLIGLGFGDCGKGLFTDALCRHWQAHTVVRFNGGAQAGHNVVLPDGRHHTFSQFGAGSFVPGVATVLASPVVVHPTALLVEAQCLEQVGVGDALSRLMIDTRCRITTPYHQAAGRLREWQRGSAAHGSCGVGVGETVRHALQHPAQALHYGDLLRPALGRDKLATLRRTLAAELDLAQAFRVSDWAAEAQLLADDGVADLWLARVQTLLRTVPPAKPAAIAERLQRPGTVLFEGAQGLLLDEWRGFHPHTSWSSVGPAAAEAVLADVGVAGPVLHLGLLRSHLTRHGAGPLPTHDMALDVLHEPHNLSGGWQGAFRRGHPDAVLLRYALDVAGPLHGLLVSHLDVFDTGPPLKWCSAYGTPGGETVSRLPLGAPHDLAHQAWLTSLLQSAEPRYAPRPLASAAEWVQRAEAVAGCPVWAGSHGPTHTDLRWLKPLA